jgi:hypothetical protein
MLNNKIKKKTYQLKNDKKKNSSQPRLICQTRDPGNETEITS